MNDITMRRSIRWESVSLTDVGCVREINEDATLANNAMNLWAVADGMGGYEAGDTASSMTIDSLSMIEDEPLFANIIDIAEDKLIEVNQLIQEYAEVMCDNKLMGSTVVSLIIRGGLGACLWVGDSRLYRYRSNNLQQFSQDHSQVEELIQQGFLKREDAVNHPEANVITRAVGACEDLFVAINVFSVQIGDTFLLCSDGLHNIVTEQQIEHCLSLDSIDDGANQLMELALTNSAPDNVSLVIVRGEISRNNNARKDSSD